MTTEVRVALIGYGLAGATFHAPTIATTPGLRLATIVTASRSGESGRAASTRRRASPTVSMPCSRTTRMTSW